MWKKLFKKYAIFILLLVALITLFLSIFIARKQSMKSSICISTGKKVVNYLYNFKDVKQLDSHMVQLKQLTTTPVYNQLTIDNEERTLNTYLKFKNKETSVKFIRCTDSYIMYSLNTEYVDSNRVFCFYYHVNNDGKIDFCEEVETIAFIKSDN